MDVNKTSAVKYELFLIGLKINNPRHMHCKLYFLTDFHIFPSVRIWTLIHVHAVEDVPCCRHGRPPTHVRLTVVSLETYIYVT